MKLIRIAHHVGQYMEFILLDEFFRLVGIYVQEYLIEMPNRWLDDREYDANIWILGHGSLEEEQREAEIQGYILVESFAKDKMIGEDKRSGFLRKVLSDVFMREGESIRENLSQLVPVYVECKLLYHSYNLRYFNRKGSPFEDYYKGFVSAYKKASKICERRSNDYAVYLRINCARKVNEVCDCMGNLREYSSRRLLSELMDLAKRNQSWHSIYVLAALIAEQEPDFRKDALYYYESAISLEKDRDSYVYYRQGRFYEKIRQDFCSAMRCYRKAVAVDPDNFRASYKIAFLNEYKELYKETLQEYNKIIDRLLEAVNVKCIQPSEFEYILKSYARMARVYRIYLDKLFAADEVLNEALFIIETIDDNKFFKYFYPKKVERINRCKAMQARLPISFIEKERRELDGTLQRYANTV